MDEESLKERTFAEQVFNNALRNFRKNAEATDIPNLLWVPRDYEYSSFLMWIGMEHEMLCRLYDGHKVIIEDVRKADVKK